MNAPDLRRRIEAVAADLHSRADEFRRLDAAVGDGDLGVTVSAAASAVRNALTGLSADASVKDMVRTSTTALADANPSTLSTLAAMGLLRSVDRLGEDSISREEAVAAGRAFVDEVQSKGGAAVGDKTILDAIVPSLDALAKSIDAGTAIESALDDAIRAAGQGVDRTTQSSAKKGRAAWAGERGIGHPDPGAVLYLRFLEAWRNAMEG